MTDTRPGLAALRCPEHLQPVVPGGRRPPGRPRIQVHRGRGVAHRVERAGVPARPDAQALRDLVGEHETEVRLAQGRAGDPLDLLQDPRAEVGVGRGPGGDSLPRPAEPDTRQVHVEADEVQHHGQRGQHHRGDRPAEDQHGQRGGGRPLHRQRDPPAPARGAARVPTRPAVAAIVAVGGRPRLGRRPAAPARRARSRRRPAGARAGRRGRLHPRLGQRGAPARQCAEGQDEAEHGVTFLLCRPGQAVAG